MTGDKDVPVSHPHPSKDNNELRWKIGGVIVVIVTLLIFLLTTRCGLLLTADSREYLAAASSFNKDRSLLGSDALPYVFWPPLFPAFLSLLPSPISEMRIVNIFLIALTGWLMWLLIDRHLQDFRFRLSCFIAFMLGVQLLLVSVFLWSELLFLVLLLLFIECVRRASDSKVAVGLALIAGTLLCLQRNAGIFIVPAAALWLYISELPRHRNLVTSLVVLASALLGFWWNAAHIFAEVPTEVSAVRFGEHPAHNLLIMSDGISRSMSPFNVMSIPLVMAMLILPVTTFWRKRRQKPELFLFELCLLFYLIGMAMIFRLGADDADRFAAAVLPAIMILCFSVVEEYFRKGSPIIKKVLLICMFVWVLYPTFRMVKNARQWYDSACQINSRYQLPTSGENSGL